MLLGRFLLRTFAGVADPSNPFHQGQVVKFLDITQFLALRTFLHFICTKSVYGFQYFVKDPVCFRPFCNLSPKTPVKRSYRILSTVEPVDPEKLVTIPLDGLLPVNILFAVVLVIIQGSHRLVVDEVLLETVVLYDYVVFLPSVITVCQKEIRLVFRMPVSMRPIQLVEVASNFKLGDQGDTAIIMVLL